MCLPLWSPFWPLLPSFVSLHDLHSGLLLAAPAFICLSAWSPFWPALGLDLCPFNCLSSWSPFWPALSFSCLHMSYVSLRDFPSGLLLAAPFVSILACFWCSCCLVSLHLSPFVISILACSWLLLPSFPRWLEGIGVLTSQWLGCWSPKSRNGRGAATALSPLVALHDLHSGLLLAAAAALSPKLAAAALSPKIVPLRDLHSGVLLAAAAALSPKLVALRDLHSGLLFAAAAALFPCCWFMGSANDIWGLCRYNFQAITTSSILREARWAWRLSDLKRGQCEIHCFFFSR